MPNEILRNEKGQPLPGQKLALGNRGGNGRHKLPEDAPVRATRAFSFLCDVAEGIIPADKLADRISAAKDVVARVFGKVDAADLTVGLGVDAQGGTCLQVSFVAADKKTNDDEV
jgi:hypothetical protein